MPEGIVLPANSVIASGTPMILEYTIGANATPAKMLAGRLVIFDTADWDVKECGATADAIAGVLMEKAESLEATAYAVGDSARVIVGGPCVVKLLYVSGGGSATPYDWLVSAADGKVGKEAVGAMGSQGARVGQILQTCTGAADTEVLVLFQKTPEPKAAA